MKNLLRMIGLLFTTFTLFTLFTILAPGSASAYLAGFDPHGEQPLDPERPDGRCNESPSVRAFPLNGHPIELDGRLDDAAWRQAEAACGFTQMEPDRGQAPTQETVFKVAYDDHALYFGVACYESDPSRVSSSLSRRDRMTASDIVSVYIDPYHDRNTAYNFRVNPVGVEEDSYLADDGNMRDTDWDAVWEAETSSDDQGWYAEMRIPFSSIRYREAESMIWGLQVYRYMHGRGEDTGWVYWDRDDAGFVSRFGTLTGLRDIPAPRQLEILPYFVSRATNHGVPGTEETWDDFQNFGADVKYGITSDLTLNATFQPDFGQVEADPAILNLSPFESYFSEKRPFFIEGGRFFEHPHFGLFYSRRIGTGSENSRIRFAGKMLGKTAGDVSVAALFAATDVTLPGQSHNPFKSGDDQTYYAVGRVGKEFAGGNHSVNLMGTGVLRDKERSLADNRPWDQRDSYSGGLDFSLNFKDREYNVEGSVVGTVVDPEPVSDDPSVAHDASVGTGGALGLHKRAGTWRAGMVGSWEMDTLNPNDLGFLQQPNAIDSRAYLRYQYNSDGEDALFNVGNQEISVRKNWVYADQAVAHPARAGEVLWSYGQGLTKLEQVMTQGWWQLKNFWSMWYGVWYTPDGRNVYDTRGGPIITEPEGVGAWLGFNTDWRKDYSFEFNFQTIVEPVGTEWQDFNLWFRWVQSTRLNHSISLGFDTKEDVDQWVGNFLHEDAEGEPIYEGGIGGTHYVFGELDRQVYDLTLRSNILFNRDQSLEIYFQPFLAVGSFSRPRELMTPDSHDLRHYQAEGFEISDYDFSRAAVNLNFVYRWEYRPGSTFYLVWTHSRFNSDRRGYHDNPGEFSNDFGLDPLFSNEPTNKFLAKMNYWFAI